jgi:hypothetical protein
MQVLRTKHDNYEFVSLYLDELDCAAINLDLIDVMEIRNQAYTNVFLPASLMDLPEMLKIKLIIAPALTLFYPYTDKFTEYGFGHTAEELAKAIERTEMQIAVTIETINNYNSIQMVPLYEDTLRYLRKTLKYCKESIKTCDNG